jgi:hypothetical protein
MLAALFLCTNNGALLRSLHVIMCWVIVIIPNILTVGHSNSDVELTPNCLTGDYLWRKLRRESSFSYLIA